MGSMGNDRNESAFASVPPDDGAEKEREYDEQASEMRQNQPARPVPLVLKQEPPQEGLGEGANAEEPDLTPCDAACSLDKFSYSERLELVGEVLEHVNSASKSPNGMFADSRFMASFPMLKAYRGEAAAEICRSAAFSKEQQNNVALACLIFYILTKGKYPQEVWGDCVREYSATALGEFWLRGKEFSSFVRKTVGERQAAEILETVKKTRREYERRDIDRILSDCSGVGAVKLFEMLWEVLITKYGNYDAKLWSRKISEFRKKTYRQRCAFKESSGWVEIYAVSSEGRLDKPLHNGCEDSSFVSIYDDATWLAVVADGVGSCIHSALGSEAATIALGDTLQAYLQRKGILDSKKRVFRHISEGDWADLMYYIKYRLATDFYAYWEDCIKKSEEYIKAEGGGLGGFSTTLQFAFGCEKFIACGRLGDGGFYVRKRVRAGSETLFGGVSLNDGISGVTRQEVFTVPNLRTNPQAMAVDFFHTEEVGDIILASDGAAGAMGATTEQMEQFAAKFSGMPFDERCEELLNVANLCSDYNETHFGSGDDSSLAFIHLKHND